MRTTLVIYGIFTNYTCSTMLNRLIRCFLLLPVLFATGCATSTKNFEAGIVPEYTTVTEAKKNKNKSQLTEMMDEMNLELQQSGPAYEKVAQIMNRLSKAAEIQQKLDVYTVDAGDQVNAFAMGGNTIVVYEELLRRLPVEEELAVVLAHETAHILGQHNADNTVQQRSQILGGVSAGVGILVGAVTGNSGLGNLASDGTSMVGSGVVLSYGRAMEHEADHIGMLLMAKAGYDPLNAIKVWRKADKVLGNAGVPSFFSSHPSHGNRLLRLKQDYDYALPYYEASGKG